MPRYADYHRTVVGYHGTKRSVALRVVQGLESIEPSRNPGDWLGHGIYFWEYAPQQAWIWAEFLKRKRRWNEETAVLACMIRLGNCFDLLDPDNVRVIGRIHEDYLAAEREAARMPASNVRSAKRLNCEVFEFAYAAFESREETVDSCRAIFVPSGPERLWEGSGINPRAHIQIVVRNPVCILGAWLAKPTQGEDHGNNGARIEEGKRESLSQGGQLSSEHEPGRSHSDVGEGGPDEPE
jgi:hypothetical protein